MCRMRYSELQGAAYKKYKRQNAFVLLPVVLFNSTYGNKTKNDQNSRSTARPAGQCLSLKNRAVSYRRHALAARSESVGVYADSAACRRSHRGVICYA